MPMVNVTFLGILADVTGLLMKHYTEVSDTNDLIIRITDDFPQLANYSYRIAVNSRIVNEASDLSDGDEIVLIPPFSGG